MKAEFEVREQTRLSMEKCFSLVLSGLQFRLFRSAVTVVVISLAVAFLVTMLADGFVGQKVSAAVDELSASRRTYLFWVDRLTTPLTEDDVVAVLASSESGSERLAEFATWGGIDDSSMAELKELAAAEIKYINWFDDLSEGHRRPLIGRAVGRDIFVDLEKPGSMEKFEAGLEGLGKQIPGSLEEFQQFLPAWSKAREGRHAILRGHREAVTSMRRTLGDTSINIAMAAADESLVEAANKLGFRLHQEDLHNMRSEGAMNVKVQIIADMIADNEFKNWLASRVALSPLEVTQDHLFRSARSTSEAADLINAANRTRTRPLEISPDDMAAASAYQQEQVRLAGMETKLLALKSDGGFMGFSARALWLIGVSLLVCVVGIANAMLMSVTERFKEIATMKCLGATDGFIMINFILESAMQGLAGGILGTLIGLLLGILRSSASYGLMAVQNLPAFEMLMMAIGATLTGVVISVLAAVYPAWVAARLAPLEAMRVE